MIELTIKQYIKKILDTDLTTNKNTFSMDWEFIFKDFDNWITLYCYTPQKTGFWIYPKLHPKTNLNQLKDQLPNFFISEKSVGFDQSGYEIEPEWGNWKDFNKSEISFFFKRTYYEEPKGKKDYFELNQIISHPLNLHWSNNKNAYCINNNSGEEVEKIKIIVDKDIKLILIRRKTLDKILHLGNWVLIRYFEFTRYDSDKTNWIDDKTEKKIVASDTFDTNYYLIYSEENPPKWIRYTGGIINLPKYSKEKTLSSLENDDEDEKRYETFIIQDLKNKTILDNYSIDPKNFATYYTKSTLPFEMSPIFFKAEVLDKYKHNPDKYNLQNRYIECRGGWYLETYAINEYNQVHTYAIYLSQLPYSEQLYWKSFNEKPKGDISKTAYLTDFEGKFPNEKPKIDILKEQLRKLSEIRVLDNAPIWSPKGGWDNAFIRLVSNAY